MFPAVVPSSLDVTAAANWSADSSQMNETLANEPLLKNKPWSKVLASPPELFFANWINGSSTVNVALSIVVVVPFTVKLPATVNAVVTSKSDTSQLPDGKYYIADKFTIVEVKNGQVVKGSAEIIKSS